MIEHLLENQEERQRFIKDNIEVTIDKQKLIEEAEWKVGFYEKEVIKSFEQLELAKLALKQLKYRYEYSSQLQSTNSRISKA
jgi:hypothetical protein